MNNRVKEFYDPHKDARQDWSDKTPSFRKIQATFACDWIGASDRPQKRQHTPIAQQLLASLKTKRERARQNAEIAKLRRQYDALVERFQQFELHYPKSDDRALSAALEKIISVSNDLFPGSVEIENSRDPEFPEDVYIVFNVTASGATKDILAREAAWHQQVSELLPDSRWKIRLFVHEQP
jgi:hypothetical protein